MGVLRSGRSRLGRSALCLALTLYLTSCMTMEDVLYAAEGGENWIVVRAVYALDQAWFVPGKGLLLYGRAMPGIPLEDPELQNEPTVSSFAAAIPLAELDGSLAASLPGHRFHLASEADSKCIEQLDAAQRVAVALLNPSDARPFALQLKDQWIRIEPVPGVTENSENVRMGPRVEPNGVYLVWLPVAFATDIVGLVLSIPWDLGGWMVDAVTGAEPEPTPDPCAVLVAELFPEPFVRDAPEVSSRR